MTPETIFKTMQDLIAEQFAIDADEIDEEDLQSLKTVGDCVRYLSNHIE